MKNLEILKGVLSEDTYAAVEEQTKNSTVELADLSTSAYVGKDKYKALEAQLEKVNGALASKTSDYDALKEKAGDNQSLKDTIEQMKTAHAEEMNTLKTDYAEQIKRSAVAAEISSKYKPRDVGDILPHVDMAKVTVDGGSVTGLAEQLDPLKESKPYLFSDDTNQSRKKGGFQHENTGNETDLSKVRAALGIKEKKE